MRHALAFLTSATLAAAAWAQEAPMPPPSAPAKAENDGLDPTAPARFAKLSFEHVDLNLPAGAPFGDNANSFIFEFQQPFGHNSFKVKAPVSSVDVLGDSSYGLGDVSAKLTHVFGVTKTHGMVVNFELVADTASRDELGGGKWVAKPGFIYAFFLQGGHIFAPAIVQSISFAGSSNRADINQTVIDFYFVPKFKDSSFYMTLDPALTHDWENDKTFLTTALTMGYKLGPMLGGNGQVFVKPSVGLGAERASDWGLQIGFQLLNF
jgi:hypothetical protein